MPSTAQPSPAGGDLALGGAINRVLRRPLLTVEEERRLARRASQGDAAARDRLVEGHLRLVVAIARAHAGRGVSRADLVQEGIAGLLRGLEGFDHRRGYRLATYAAWWIRRAMLHAIAAAPAIRLPEGGHRELAAVLRAESEITSGRRRAAAGTLASRTGLSPRRVERLRTVPRVVASLDARVDGGAWIGELVADPGALDPAARLERDDARRQVVAALGLLDRRSEQVLRLRFGFGGEAPLAYDRIGERLGIGAERVRQLETEALRRLRAVAEQAHWRG